MEALVETLLSVGFSLCVFVGFVCRKSILCFVSGRVSCVRDLVNAAQRKRLESLMQLKQVKARSGVVTANGERLAQKACDDVQNMKAGAESRAEKALGVAESTAWRLAKVKQRSLVMRHRQKVLSVAYLVSKRLLEQDYDRFNDQEAIIARLVD